VLKTSPILYRVTISGKGEEVVFQGKGRCPGRIKGGERGKTPWPGMVENCLAGTAHRKRKKNLGGKKRN